MRMTVTWLLAVLFFMPVAAVKIGATVIHVPMDQSSVQGGIDAAASGDTVLVAPGRYNVNVNFRDKNIVLASNYLLSGSPDDIWNTVLDGSQPTHSDTASVIIIAGGQDTAAAVIGFTITGGRGTKWLDVSDNLVYREGGGLLTEGCTPRIMYNLIMANVATEKVSGVRSAGGGGIRCGFGPVSGMPLIIGNVFAFNQGLYGGAIVSFHCAVTLRNNIIWANSGGQDFGGGGIWMVSNSDTSYIENNTIFGNNSALQGGGALINGSPAKVRNNIIRGNSGSPAQLSAGGGAVTVQYNNIQGGFAGIGNVDEPPLFDATNFYLTPGSPCVDSGDAAPQYYDREDPGNPGFALFPALGELRNDKGAYGGLGGEVLPNFVSPRFGAVVDSIDLGSVEKETFNERAIHLEKLGFGTVIVDSVHFGHSQRPELYSTSGSLAMGVKPGIDSLILLWNPQEYATLIDTAFIYHRDTTRSNPIEIVVTGKVSCCQGSVGNVDGFGMVDLSDLSLLVAYLTWTDHFALGCMEEANMNRAGIVDLTDLSILIAYLKFPPGTVSLPACP